MSARPQPEPTAVLAPGDVAEKRSFFGAGAVLDAYRGAWTFRPGEEHVFGRYLGTGGRLLDIGCGTGRTSFLLAERFEHVDAFDIVPEMIEVARERNRELGLPIRFFTGDARDLGEGDARYDAVLFSYNGIEGILDPKGRERVLAEAWRVLKPGGAFVFTTKSCFKLTYWRRFFVPRFLARLGLGRHDGGDTFTVTRVDGPQRLQWNTTNPFAMRAALRRQGFELLYFNSEIALARGVTDRRWSANFHPHDHFFACRKPPQP